MAEQPKFVDASFYATVEPIWKNGHHPTWSQDDKGRPILAGAKVVSITQNRPKGRTKAGAIVTRLTLRIDANALLPLQPEAVIQISAGDVDLIEVTADAPSEEDIEP